MGSRRTYAALRRRAGIALGVWAVAFTMLAAVAAIPEGPHVVLTVSTTRPIVGQAVVFNASASQGHDEGNGKIVAYRFDFGDGTGTDWQSSPTATHAYTSPGTDTASVTAKDKRGLTGSDSVILQVLPPPPPAPDVRPALAEFVPARPSEGDLVNLTVVLVNRGTATAEAASITATDLRPNGTTASLGALPLPAALPPSGVVTVVFGPFAAEGVGNHTLQIRAADVRPAEPNPAQGALNVTMTVLPSSGPPPSPGPQIQILAANLDPSHPRVGQTVNLSALIWNRGTAAALAATVDAYDVRPDGSVAFLGSAPLTSSLPPSTGATLILPPFVASAAGNHTIRLVVANVTPTPQSSVRAELDVILSVAGPTPPVGPTGPTPLEFGPVVLGLAAAGVAAVAGAAYFLLRRPPSGPLEPPPPTPPDQSPPPIFPP